MEGKSKRGAGSRNLVFFVGEVKVLFCGFGLSVFDLVLWFRAIWIPIKSITCLDDEMSKKCMPLWREAHFEVKMHKAHRHRSTSPFTR